MEQLPGLWSLTPIGALVGFIVLLGWMLATGRIATRREVEARIAAIDKGYSDVVKAKDERISELMDREERLVKRGDDWHGAFDTEKTAHDVTRQQLLPAVMEVGQIVTHVMGALPVPSNRGHSGTQETS